MKLLRPKQIEFNNVELTAAEWYSRREFGLTPRESEKLVAWLNADSRHAEVFNQLEETSQILDQWSEALPALSNRLPFAPRTVRATNFRRWSWVAALAALIAVIGVSAWRIRAFKLASYTLTAATEVGGLRTLALADGSSIRLNTDSAVDVRYSKEQRLVRLIRGEALFTVAKNHARPFYVEAGGVSIRAIGTAFDVCLRSNRVDVLVTEGKVRVEDSAQGDSLLPAISDTNEPPVLEAGNGAVVAIHPMGQAASIATVVAVPAREIARTLAWQERRLEFGSVPLSEVVAEFNRYNTHKLVINDPGLAAQQFGGTFRATSYETLLSLLERNFDVVLDRHENETILRRRGH